MKSENGKHESENFGGFRRWVTSLNREELLDAMAFSFQPDPMTRVPSLETYNSARLSSHEYDLLLSMVQLQPPPSTPVHPRATGYKSRSQKGARLDYFFKEEEHLRWTKPRLFQWAEQSEQPSTSYNNFGGRVNRSHSRFRNGTKSSRNASAARKRRFNVIARQKVAPWGDVYSLGSTHEQYNADCKLIRGTCLGRLRRDGRYHSTACFVSSKGREEFDNGIECKSGGEKKPKSDDGSTASSILKMLRIASRGHFFLQDPTSSDAKTQTAEVPFYAPWLQPTERWFSLGMYLASRFQMALWDSYLKDQLNQRQQQYATHPGRLIREGGNWQGYKESMLRDALIRAIRSGLREMLKEERISPRLNYLRDGTLWSILEGHQKGHFLLPETASWTLLYANENTKGHWKTIARAWTQFQLVEIHSPFNSKFKSLVCENLEAELVAQMEQAMFVEDKLEQQKSSKDTGTGNQTGKKKRKKNKRKKSKQNNGSTNKLISQMATPTPTELATPARIDKEGDHVPIPSGPLLVEGGKAPTKPLSTNYEFPKNSVTAHKRNNNIVFVLGILEDVTEKVFSEVGLAATPKFDNSVLNTINESISKANNLKQDASIQNISHKEDILDKTNGDVETSVEVSSLNQSARSFASGLIQTSRSLDQEFTNHDEGNTFSLYTGQNEAFQSNIYNQFVVGSDFSLNHIDDIGGYVENWRFENRFQSRERSILTNFFESQNEKIGNNKDDDDEERLMAASTAASIASSSYKDTAYIAETEELSIPANVVTNNEVENNNHFTESVGNGEKTSSASSLDFDLDANAAGFDDDEDHRESIAVAARSDHGNESNDTISGCRSPILQAPSTPPPTLSPILVSLADLKKVKEFRSIDFNNATSHSGPGSLPPNSPGPQDGMVCSWSREDLRIESFRDDHQIKNQQINRIKSRRRLQMPTYKSVAVKALANPSALLKDDSASPDQDMQFILSLRREQHENKESCAQSEAAIDSDQRDHQEWYREEADNHSLTKDETTTIISGISHRVESEELVVVQEERNSFRDMCLTLGAEVAKLKVMLATQQAVAAAPVDFQDSSFGYAKMNGHGSFDPHGMQPFFNGMSHGLRAGAKSDAGFHRNGDHESLFSEEDVYDPVSKARETRMDSVQYMASSQTIASHTVAESDTSTDFNSIKATLPVGQISGTITASDSFQFNGLQSRLTKDILQFLAATSIKMKKLDGRRKLAVQRT